MEPLIQLTLCILSFINLVRKIQKPIETLLKFPISPFKGWLISEKVEQPYQKRDNHIENHPAALHPAIQPCKYCFAKAGGKAGSPQNRPSLERKNLEY